MITLAVLACADGDRVTAGALTDAALVEYTGGRPDGRPLPTGEALVNVVTRLDRPR